MYAKYVWYLDNYNLTSKPALFLLDQTTCISHWESPSTKIEMYF